MKLRMAAGLAAVALITAATAPNVARADLLDEIQARGTLVCGILPGSPPFGYLDTQKQEVVGYEIDLCRLAAEHLGVESELKNVSPAARVPELVQGRVDLLATLLTYSPERAQQLDFTGAYIHETFSFMVVEESGITSVDELDGKRIGVVSGSFLEALIPPRLPNATVVAFENQSANFLALQQGKVHASAMRYSQAKTIEVNAGASARPLVALPEPLAIGASGFGVRKGEDRLREALNAFLVELEESGEGERLFNQWLGEGTPYKVKKTFAFGAPLS